MTFDINNLVSPSVRNDYLSIKDPEEKADFLLKLLDYEVNFKDKADDIASYFNDHSCVEYDPMVLRPVVKAKENICSYAAETKDIKKTIRLINDLCDDCILENDNFETIIDKAKSEFSMIDDLNGAEFTFEEKKSTGKVTIDRVLAMKGGG
ncbi:MAG: hypothetical protein IJS61_08620 [Firmicutes bacterium]|nr:hypothetical protein [Bacillota bacterium]